jgi:hypothetical protein
LNGPFLEQFHQVFKRQVRFPKNSFEGAFLDGLPRMDWNRKGRDGSVRFLPTELDVAATLAGYFETCLLEGTNEFRAGELRELRH